MLIPTPPKFRKPRFKPRKSGASPTPPVLPLNLVSAAYIWQETRLELTFDRAINLRAFDGMQITVNDPVETGVLFNATGDVSLNAPNQLWVTLVEIDEAHGDDVLMNASANTGIVATNDGGTWPGAVNYPLET